ncbi:hypothetical protein C8J56DRAFT_1163821 [Mycena floridula]|nr:hypothetical protein C8J56DRAFT_1163821 [Mycena floridula]
MGKAGPDRPMPQRLKTIEATSFVVIHFHSMASNSSHVLEWLRQSVDFALPTLQPIPDDQADKARIALDAIRYQREAVGSRIARLLAELKCLEREHSALNRPIFQFAAELSPIRRVPAEILTEIFLYCVDLDDGYNVLDIEAVPWSLSHACQAWRSVAISTPELWTSMRIISHSENNLPGRISMFEEALLRCRNRLIDMFITDGRDEAPVDAVRDLALRQSSRWRSIRFSCYTPCLEEIKGHLEMLQVLRLNDPGDDPDFLDAYDDWVLGDEFSDAPRLRELDARIYGDPLDQLEIPWTQLTKITCHPIQGTETLLQVLEQSPNLVDFTIITTPQNHTVPAYHESEPLSEGRIIHDALSSLTTTNVEILRNITCPGLKEVTIPSIDTEIYLEDSNTALELQKMLKRSKCSLTKLSLVGCALDETIFQVISSMPELEHLALRGAMDKTFFLSLILLLSPEHIRDQIPLQPCWPMQNSLALPRLEEIDLTTMGSDGEIQCLDRYFVAMVESRLLAGLTRLHIAFDFDASLARLSEKDIATIETWSQRTNLDFKLTVKGRANLNWQPGHQI